MRLFVGVPLADSVARELATVVARLRGGEGGGRIDGLRWSEPESWHVTLQFLGNATAEQLECLKARLHEVRCAPVAVELGELGSFERTGVLFVDVSVTPGLAALQQHVVTATSECGFVAEARPFHPHITLARETGKKGSRERGNKRAWEQGGEKARGQKNTLRELLAVAGKRRTLPRFTAREFLLYESHLGAGGSKYEVRMRVALADE